MMTINVSYSREQPVAKVINKSDTGIDIDVDIDYNTIVDQR
jgi:hypothetical protein